MNIVDAEKNLKKVSEKFSKETFIFDLMIAYDFPKSTISKLKIKYKNHDDVVVPSKLHFVGVSKKELDTKFDELVKHYSTVKKAPRFVIVTDYQNLKAYDTKVAEKLDAEIKNLSKHPDFFLPWAGIEKKVFQGENPADVKAAEKLAKFFDLILKDNLKLVEKKRHALNVFLTRILFGFFAEDTDIFKKGLFTESIASHTKADGSDLDDYLKNLFEILNTRENKRPKKTSEYLNKFPYVNGGLFAEEYPIPKFSKKSRESFIDLGSDLNWAEINPDIFGSMIQAVVHPDQRAGLGMHYTSVTNIMKVIEPLFLTELKEEFINAKGNKNKLKKLLERIGNIKIFDPACGSGNFLIIAYKELRLLEMDILKVLGEIPMSGITLSNYYGIEIDDFAHEVAKLSLWLAEHQMNVLFNRQFGEVRPSLPLKDSGKIVCGNAIKENWRIICPITSNETFLIGNPPYLGSRNQSDEHKKDMQLCISDGYKSLDYVSCWFLKASEYIRNTNSAFSFVSTNSICQGEQVGILWPKVLEDDLEIFFAHQSFKWTNSAKDKAAVICIIVGVKNKTKTKTKKKIFRINDYIEVDSINAYLAQGKVTYIGRRSSPLSEILPKVVYGTLPNDGGNLILNKKERDELLKKYPKLSTVIKKFIGAQEFLKGQDRWCLAIPDADLSWVSEIPEILVRLKKVTKQREESTEKSTRALALNPNRFYFTAHKNTEFIIIPLTSSERREYIPAGYMNGNDTIVSNLALAIFDAKPFVLGIVSSRMHMTWMRAVAGRLKSDYRYSGAIVYNNFPIPSLTKSQIDKISQFSLAILGEREKNTALSLADQYDPKIMPENLRRVHKELDDYVDSCYHAKKFVSDDERLGVLFEMYDLQNQGITND